jgi:hypothetical protein
VTIKERKADDSGWWLTDTGGLADHVIDNPTIGWFVLWVEP